LSCVHASRFVNVIGDTLANYSGQVELGENTYT
jgi:hypothetical protein